MTDSFINRMFAASLVLEVFVAVRIRVLVGKKLSEESTVLIVVLE